MVDDQLFDFGEMLLWLAPIYLTLFAGMIFVFARWERHPATSLWAGSGFGWLLMVTLAATAWRCFAVPEWFPDPGPPTSLEESLSYVFFSVLASIGFVLLIVGLVADRRPRPSRYHEYPDDGHDRG